jgi:translation initiation factor 1
MSLEDQLKKLFPDHKVSNKPEGVEEKKHKLFSLKKTNDLQM